MNSFFCKMQQICKTSQRFFKSGHSGHNIPMLIYKIPTIVKVILITGICIYMCIALLLIDAQAYAILFFVPAIKFICTL